jgi:hypothetical protein
LLFCHTNSTITITTLYVCGSQCEKSRRKKQRSNHQAKHQNREKKHRDQIVQLFVTHDYHYTMARCCAIAYLLWVVYWESISLRWHRIRHFAKIWLTHKTLYSIWARIADTIRNAHPKSFEGETHSKRRLFYCHFMHAGRSVAQTNESGAYCMSSTTFRAKERKMAHKSYCAQWDMPHYATHTHLAVCKRKYITSKRQKKKKKKRNKNNRKTIWPIAV